MYASSWGYLDAKWGKYYTLEPFKYQFTSDALAAAGQQPIIIQMASDCWHAIVGLIHYASTAAFATGDFTLTLTIENRDLQDGAIFSHLYGTPYINMAATNYITTHPISFPFPKYVRPGGNIQGIITNGGVANNIVRLVLDCVKLFPKMKDAEPPRPMSDRARSLETPGVR